MTAARSMMAALALSLVACSSGGGTSPKDPNSTAALCAHKCPDRSGVDLDNPPTTFASDVFPIFAANCTQGACHGSGAGAKATLELGPSDVEATPAEISAVYDGLQRASVAVDTMMLVAAGDPNVSFLMLKVEGCQNSLGLSCVQILPNQCNKPCGEPMPPLPRDTYPALADNDILTVRRWIAQGAQP